MKIAPYLSMLVSKLLCEVVCNIFAVFNKAPLWTRI